MYEGEFLATRLCGVVNDLDVGLNRNETGMRFLGALKVLGDLGPTLPGVLGDLGPSPTPVQAFEGFGPVGFGSLRAL